jgi:hypothetical protein
MADVDEEPVAVGEEEEEEVAADEDEIFAGAGSGVGGPAATEIKLFGKWSFDDIEIRDISLVVRVNPSQILYLETLCIFLLLDGIEARTHCSILLVFSSR